MFSLEVLYGCSFFVCSQESTRERDPKVHVNQLLCFCLGLLLFFAQPLTTSNAVMCKWGEAVPLLVSSPWSHRYNVTLSSPGKHGQSELLITHCCLSPPSCCSMSGRRDVVGLHQCLKYSLVRVVSINTHKEMKTQTHSWLVSESVTASCLKVSVIPFSPSFLFQSLLSFSSVSLSVECDPISLLPRSGWVLYQELGRRVKLVIFFIHSCLCQSVSVILCHQ